MSVRGGSLGENLPPPAATEDFQTLVQSGAARIERIVSYGHASETGDWYDQDWDEFVLVVSGQAALLVEGEAAPRVLGPGDWLFLPRRTRHRVTATHPEMATVWLAVHVGEPAAHSASPPLSD